ncbi:PQQ-dependent sugar dehydrogenase [Algoriphagus halophytocola]|uniref:PQQ-dependent sugar dehydrogenase n=1 Tax=Algoriphagus halophytocola TaxID=2991499 RepID=A0ABY6MHM2_9BACT|nr:MULTISPECIES: PQQ-dependent sugar dehydrogenase [unclassified Algoriphagus]UZD23282.1 PQQ-dependent sugar dehydrogenase [Algoriphagus sp. TR-M5]WBL44576.1 PQQ-dependent sugar dehydrogenase [Algoriphagus sp. TR-M9]
MKHVSSSITLVLLLFCAANAQESPNNTTAAFANLEIEEAFPQLSFTRPVDFQHAGDGSGKLYVVEQRGVISVFENEKMIGAKSEFLNIEARVEDSSNEEGLLGLAFHPNFEANGYFYLNYTASNPDRTVISRFTVSSSNPLQANAASELVLLEFEQPYSNHNGGQVAFGPDGYLYIGVGDGGRFGDPHENSQNLKTFLGSILRIDVDGQSEGKFYGIPSDNPFVHNSEGYKEEIYAYGLRNPWRFSFDSQTGQLWLGDVGQNKYEEIDIIQKGGNYGWNIMEADDCYKGRNCKQEGLQLPVWQYDRSQGDVSITGGYVYRGDKIPALKGKYIYADYASGRIWSLDTSNPNQAVNTLLVDADFPISSFGVDQNQELFICAFDDKIYKFK